MSSIKEKIMLFFFKRETKKPAYQQVIEAVRAGWNWLEGKRSQVLAGLAWSAVIAYLAGFITKEQLETVAVITGPAFAYTFSSKVSRGIEVLKKTNVLPPETPKP